MAPGHRPGKRRAELAALMVVALAMFPIGQAMAYADKSPFGGAVRLTDAALDTIRGGFAGSDGSLLRFAVNLQTTINGQPVASLSISNDAQGRIQASVQNFGRTVVLLPDGSVQIMTSPQISPLPVIVTTTLTPTLPSTVTTGAVLVTTGLLPNGHGVLTLIQNTQSNVVVHALQTLNIQLSGVGNTLVSNGTVLRGFANSMNFSVRR